MKIKASYFILLTSMLCFFLFNQSVLASEISETAESVIATEESIQIEQESADTFEVDAGYNSTVTNLKASVSGRYVKLTWPSVSNADGYLVYRQKTGETKFTYLYMTSNTSYTDTKAEVGVFSFYRVYPYKYINGKMTVGKSGSYVYAKPNAGTTTTLKASSQIGSVKLTWSSVPGAEGYLVYGQKSGSYGYVGMTKGTSYTDTKALTNEYNFYWVFPYVYNSSGKMIPGGCSKYVYGKSKLDTYNLMTFLNMPLNDAVKTTGINWRFTGTDATMTIELSTDTVFIHSSEGSPIYKLEICAKNNIYQTKYHIDDFTTGMSKAAAQTAARNAGFTLDMATSNALFYEKGNVYLDLHITNNRVSRVAYYSYDILN